MRSGVLGRESGKIMQDGLYIYGIMNSGDSQDFGEIGIGDRASQVLTIGYEGIAAVVSRSPLVVYDSLAKERTVKDLVSHQYVIEKVMLGCTIIPVKFGMMVESEEDVVAFLKTGYELLNDELSKMEGKIELDVVATWELSRILPVMLRSDRRIREKQRDIAAKGAAVAIEEKIELGTFVEQALKAKKAEYCELIGQRLKEEVDDVCLHELANDEMIFNGAFLLAKQHEGAFQEAVTSLDRAMEDTVHFRIVGPLPVYSFATIVLERVDVGRFEEAKKTFGLSGEITEQKVRDAYRRLARTCHPDGAARLSGGRGKEAANLNFHALHAAYRTLEQVIEHGLTHVSVYRWEKDVP